MGIINRIGIYVILGILALSVNGCEIINPAEDIPSYIKIEPFQLTTQVDEGSASQSITDGWVYVDEILLGAYTLPATIPVLETGEQEIIVDPGIKENGISATPVIFPYYDRFTTSVNLTETETIAIQPKTQYKGNVEFVFIENFEGSHIFTDDRDEYPETAVSITDDGSFEGNSGKITLTKDSPLFDVATLSFFENLPSNGIKVYLEINYKTEVEFGVGLRGRNFAGAEELYVSNGLNRSAIWKKVYINLTNTVIDANLEYYQVSLVAELPDEMESADIMIDNIKLLHFEF